MKHRILIIEDETSISDTIRYALETEAFDCLSATTGEEGLRHLKNNKMDLIILDVGLPDQSGFELCRTIRKTSNIPIIFLTARVEEVDRVLGLEIGGDDYVPKPFSPRELVSRVKAILRRTSEEPLQQEPTPSALFTIDQERLRISFKGTPLDLSRYEYRLLCVLVKRPGRVYSREELMNRAWEVPEMSLERTIDTHIKTIRSKLRLIDPKDDSIITHRGFGYSLREEA